MWNHSTRFVAPTVVCLLLSATSAQATTIETEANFAFQLPDDMVKLDQQGIDSYVECYRNPTIYLCFDYGIYGRPATEPDIVIDGYPAQITAKPYFTEVHDTLYTYYAGLAFQDIGRAPDSLNMDAFMRTKADLDTVLSIFRSVRIHSVED